MNKKMLKILKNKNIFVDIDGTLAEYRFNNHLSAKDGTSNGQTVKEIENHIFLYSRPLNSVIKTIKKAKVKNVFICGAIISPIELTDKIEWLKCYCKGIYFKEYYWFVPEEYWNVFFKKTTELLEKEIVYNKYGYFFKGSKNCFWEWLKKNNNKSIKDIIFIDDVLSYLKYAEENGINSYHISSFL